MRSSWVNSLRGKKAELIIGWLWQYALLFSGNMPALRFTIIQPPSEIRWSIQEPGFSTEILRANAVENGGNNRTSTMTLLGFKAATQLQLGKVNIFNAICKKDGDSSWESKSIY